MITTSNLNHLLQALKNELQGLSLQDKRTALNALDKELATYTSNLFFGLESSIKQALPLFYKVVCVKDEDKCDDLGKRVHGEYFFAVPVGKELPQGFNLQRWEGEPHSISHPLNSREMRDILVFDGSNFVNPQSVPSVKQRLIW